MPPLMPFSHFDVYDAYAADATPMLSIFSRFFYAADYAAFFSLYAASYFRRFFFRRRSLFID